MHDINRNKMKSKKKKRFILYSFLLSLFKTVIVLCGMIVVFFNFYIDPFSTKLLFSVDRGTKNTTSSLYEMGTYHSYFDHIYHPNDRILNMYKRTNEQQQQSSTTTTASNNFCNWASQQNSMNLFIQNLHTILLASQHPLDPNYFLYNTTYSTLIQILPRLFKSTKTLPILSHDTITKLIQKIEHRYEYITNPKFYAFKYNTTTTNTNIPSPITITILGGSVTMGVNCYTGIPRLDLQRCSWPIRLEYFINQIVQRTIQQQRYDKYNTETNLLPFVKVETLAMGGTNTATGQIILEYDILNELHPDILINAYSTNDMHILTVKDTTTIEKLYDKLLQMGQNFTRTFYHRQQQQQCQMDSKNTILLWLDDYIGNEQREILSIQTLSQTLHILSNYYGFGYISYADTVRDLIYSDTTETMFSPSGWYTTPSQSSNSSNNRKADTTMKREIHPGQGMHMATVWIVAYNILTMLISQCNILSLVQNNVSSYSQMSNVPRDKVLAESIRNNLPIQSKMTLYPYEKLPPPLTSSLSLDTISTLWQTTKNSLNSSLDCSRQQQQLVTSNSTGTNDRRCPISWISGLPQRDLEWIQNYFEPFIQTPNAWEIVDHSIRKDKYGWMPKIPQNYDIKNPQMQKLVMEFDINTIEMIHRIRTITLFYLKSYGKRWRSAVQVIVEQKLTNGEYSTIKMNDYAGHVVLLSHHDKNTSEILSTTISIPNNVLSYNNELVRHNNTSISTSTSAIRITFTLIRGRRFKLMGIILCK